MGQPRHRARLAQEPVAHLCLGSIARPARPQHLERNGPAQLCVPRRIDDAHSARGDRTDHFVSTGQLPLGIVRLRSDLREQLPAGIAAAQMRLGLRPILGRETTLDVLQ